MIIQLTNGSQRLTLSTRGATIFDWDPGIGTSVLDGYRSLAEQEENDGFRNAVLAPWSNRTEDATWDDDGVARSTLGLTNAEGLHGLVWNRDFEIANVGAGANQREDADADECNINAPSIELVTHIPDSEAFPGPITVSVRYEISTPDALGVAVTARNDTERPIPVGLGWHPYVRVASVDQARLWLAATHKIVTDERLLPLSGQAAFQLLDDDRTGDPRADIVKYSGREAVLLPAWVPTGQGMKEINLHDALDSGFTGLSWEEGKAVAYLDTGLGYGVEMTMRCDDGIGRPNFHVFTGAPLKRDPLTSVALEPCLTIANMLNRGEEKARSVLQAGTERTLHATVRLTH
ncbi:aldose 1-epimerase [Trueperella pecoris]|uniref:Aldose 1-epimerase n=1 Tax=Trueperella pecoris TaxID=2733571 RepID=A0A7M1R082_9ACTO|nr:aldose 1-epimerase [Trueperella pecoris]QOR47546.1 aldose 1-epimerase [Trueperella pecoris]QTG75349.1 aldose 1-epimerase [Trueperella pecoris]